MKKDFNFTTAFAMRCDAEHYASVINELRKMGYNSETITPFSTSYYLINNYAGGKCVTNIMESNKTDHNRIVIETFNRELCLALAAMTDRKKPIIGEWVELS